MAFLFTSHTHSEQTCGKENSVRHWAEWSGDPFAAAPLETKALLSRRIKSDSRRESGLNCRASHVQPSNQLATWFPDLLTPSSETCRGHPNSAHTQHFSPSSVIYMSGTRSQISLRTRTNTQASWYAALASHQSSAKDVHTVGSP